MPRYEYKEEYSGIVVTVDRKIADRDLPPTLPELVKVGADISALDEQQCKWERLQPRNVGKSRSSNFGTKGNWGLVLASLLSLYGCGEPRVQIQENDSCKHRVVTIQVPVSEPSIEEPVIEPQDEPNTDPNQLTPEPQFIHRGSLCNSTIVSIGDSYFAIYGNMLLPIYEKFFKIRELKINKVNYSCSVRVGPEGQLEQKLKELE